MPPSEGQEPRALTVAAQAIEGRKCAETAKVHPDLRIVYNLAYGVLAGEAGRFFLVGDYTTRFERKRTLRRPFFIWGSLMALRRVCATADPSTYIHAVLAALFSIHTRTFPHGRNVRASSASHPGCALDAVDRAKADHPDNAPIRKLRDA